MNAIKTKTNLVTGHWSRVTFFLIVVSFFIADFAFGASTCGGITPCLCGYNVTSSYTLTEDLECSTSTALNIGATGIIIDCNNHRIIGAGLAFSKAISSLTSYNNVTIKNCNIEQFAYGVYVNVTSGAGNWTIDNNNFLSDNVGIYGKFGTVTGGNQWTITNNDILEPKDYGVNLGTTGVGIHLERTKGSTIQNNRIIVGNVGLASHIAVYLIDPRNYGTPLTEFDGNFVSGFDGVGTDIKVTRSAPTKINIYNNVFSGRISQEVNTGMGTLNWCASDSDNANIFTASNEGLPPYIYPPTLNTADPKCLKLCIDQAQIDTELSSGDTLTLNSNQCIKNIASTDYTFIGAVDNAITFGADNIILDCNIEDLNGSDSNYTGIFADSKSRGTIVGCNLNNFTKAIHLHDSTDFLLRQNNLASATIDSGTKTIKSYHLHVQSSPPYNKAHYDHQIFNDINPVSALLNKMGAKNIYYYYNRDNFVWNTSIDDGLVGHLTVASSKDITVEGIDRLGAPNDPFTFAFLSNTQADSGNINVNYNFIDDNSNLDAQHGFVTIASRGMKFESNAATSNIPGSYGFIASDMATSTIGHITDPTKYNFFHANEFGGLWYEGKYYNSAGTEGKERWGRNYFYNNKINNNDFWGMVVTNGYGENIVSNLIYDNGQDDDESPTDGFGSSPIDPSNLGSACNDDLDNDGDGLCDFDGCTIGGQLYASDPACIDANDVSEAYSPGVYFNLSHDVWFSNNQVYNNSGDNLFIDSTNIPGTYAYVDAQATAWQNRKTRGNMFDKNDFLGSLNGSGVYVIDGTQSQGKAEYNLFGFLPLGGDIGLPTWATAAEGGLNIGADMESEWKERPFYGASCNVSGCWWKGNNRIGKNAIDGMTFVANHNETEGTVSQNDVFNNIFYGNSRNGIAIQGISGNDSVSRFNDILQNDISTSTHGIFATSTAISRIARNTIYQNNESGIKLVDSSPITSNFLRNYIGSKDTKTNPTPNGIGQVFAAGTSFENTLKNNAKGIVLIDTFETKADGNIIKSHERAFDLNRADNTQILKHEIGKDSTDNGYGIYILNSDAVNIDSNTIADFTKGGIYGYGSDNVLVGKTTVKDGKYIVTGPRNIGIAVINSTNWDFSPLGCLSTNYVQNQEYPGQYLYVGPDIFNKNPIHPDIAEAQSYYDHEIISGNCVGIYGDEVDSYAIPLLYANGSETSGFNFTNMTFQENGGSGNPNEVHNIKDSKHLQIHKYANLGVDFDGSSVSPDLELSEMDPVHLSFISPDNSYKNDFKKFTLKDCRGDCMILYAVDGVDVDDDPVRFTNISVSGTQGNNIGILGHFVKNSVFTDNTIANVNFPALVESGGMYLYSSQNNIIEDNTFMYTGPGHANVPTGNYILRRWELFLASESTGNTVFLNNFDGLTSGGSGAYEFRYGLTDKEYTEDETYNDSFCFSSGIDVSNSDSFCDPQCRKAEDYDCQVIYQYDPLGPNCSNTSGNCCNDNFDGVIDQDCGEGVDPDRKTGTAYADGLCFIDLKDGLCDSNCTFFALKSGSRTDPDCSAITTACPNTLGDCCNPAPDNVCDNDCPRGFDPDCVADNNNWCTITTEDVVINENIWDNLEPALNKPNYYFTLTETIGGGGIPNDAFQCTLRAPRVRFPVDDTDDCDGLKCVRQYDDYRDLFPSLRKTNLQQFWVYADFADANGLNVVGSVRASATESGTYELDADISSDPAITASVPDPPLSPLPDPNNDNNDYSIGDFDADPILTIDLDGDYPIPSILWDDNDPPNASFTRLKFLWDATQMTTFTGGQDGNKGTYWAQLGGKSQINIAGFTDATNDPLERNRQFNYDFKAPEFPTDPNFRHDASDDDDCSHAGCTVPYTYVFKWDSDAIDDSWTNDVDQAHYEIWYGSPSDVQNRSGSVKVYDDRDATERAGSGLTYGDDLCDSGGVGEGTNPCYDSRLGFINFNTNERKVIIRTNDLFTASKFCAVDDFGNDTCKDINLYPYLSTTGGNIYSGGNIGSGFQPVERTVGSFLILAGGSIQANWKSLWQDAVPESRREGYPTLGFPDPNNQFTTNIGSLDFLNHTTPNTTFLTYLQNRYGANKVVDGSYPASGSVLEGKIYVINGNHTFDNSSFTFGSANGKNGSGLIIIKGDLTFNKGTMVYDDSNADALSEIPSVAWIVLGDIIIKPEVEKIVGAFMALGDGDDCPPTVFEDSDQCGRIHTEADNDQLIVEGLMFARQFYFLRATPAQPDPSNDIPSELIKYDGRVIANPPPGLESFIEGLPLWLEELN